MRTGRVQTRAQFTALRERGVRSRQGMVRVTFVAGAGLDDRVAAAFAIGKPVGTAVVRNRIRRRLRAALRTLDPPPGHYLIAVTPDAADASYQALRADLAACLAGVAVPG